jgi:hypothetical protein
VPAAQFEREGRSSGWFRSMEQWAPSFIASALNIDEPNHQY